MAFEIRDLMIDVLPQRAGRGGLWASCTDVTDVTDSECPEPSCGPQCQPHSHCGPVTRPGPPKPPKPGPEGTLAAPAGLLLLRQQLRQTLSRQL